MGAAKLGLFGTLAVFFKKAWKLIVVGIIAVAGLFRKMFGGLSGRRNSPSAEE